MFIRCELLQCAQDPHHLLRPSISSRFPPGTFLSGRRRPSALTILQKSTLIVRCFNEMCARARVSTGNEAQSSRSEGRAPTQRSTTKNLQHPWHPPLAQVSPSHLRSFPPFVVLIEATSRRRPTAPPSTVDLALLRPPLVVRLIQRLPWTTIKQPLDAYFSWIRSADWQERMDDRCGARGEEDGRREGARRGGGETEQPDRPSFPVLPTLKQLD